MSNGKLGIINFLWILFMVVLSPELSVQKILKKLMLANALYICRYPGTVSIVYIKWLHGNNCIEMTHLSVIYLTGTGCGDCTVRLKGMHSNKCSWPTYNMFYSIYFTVVYCGSESMDTSLGHTGGFLMPTYQTGTVPYSFLVDEQDHCPHWI